MKKRVAFLVSILLSLLVGVAVILNRYQITDWWTLRTYQPSEQIEQISRSVDFTDYGQRIFYVHDPQILDANGFNSSCPNRESSIVLGCYADGTIYVFDVQEQQLEGVEEVTAAHEMLHAAYDRLSSKDKDELEPWLLSAYESLSDQRVRDVLATYNGLPQDSLLNEYHSIFATEVKELPDYLEDYYANYFADRSVVVEISSEYAAVFDNIKSQVEQYQARLQLLRVQINNLEASLAQQAANIERESVRLETLLSNDQVEAYNSAIPSFNGSLQIYRNSLSSYNAKIEEYNSVVKLVNALTGEQNQLVNSLDSRFNDKEQE